jgi:bifunctional DNase/RNase
MPDEVPEAPAGDPEVAETAAETAGETAAGEPIAAAAIRGGAAFRVVEVLEVELELPDQFPVVVLQELEAPLREVRFPVGLAEGTALSYALRKQATPRPLTHELVATLFARFRIDLVAVRLTGRTRGIYLAELSCMGANGAEVIACRPTDGITLALRLPIPAPILCDERLLATEADVEPL